MPLILHWDEILLRLALTVLAGSVIGLNREGHDRPAGLRTTLLVCLAASISMILANLLLGTVGKTANSFISMDVMRLPLGILTGMGFIGAGAVIQRGSLVTGVTTAATLWFVTVVGLCFGGGQIALGLIALALGVVVLWCLKWVENWIKHDRRAEFVLMAGSKGPTDDDIRRLVGQAGYEIVCSRLVLLEGAQSRETSFDVKWQAKPEEDRVPSFVDQIARVPGVGRVEWKPR